MKRATAAITGVPPARPVVWRLAWALVYLWAAGLVLVACWAGVRVLAPRIWPTPTPEQRYIGTPDDAFTAALADTPADQQVLHDLQSAGFTAANDTIIIYNANEACSLLRAGETPAAVLTEISASTMSYHDSAIAYHDIGEFTMFAVLDLCPQFVNEPLDGWPKTAT